MLLSSQILALTLIPILSGVLPGSRAAVDLPALLGLEKPLSGHFMVGTWKYSDHFMRWGITDKEKVRIDSFKGQAFMSLKEDGTLEMVNLFRPDQGRWEMTDRGIIIYDPKYPERGSQLLPVLKRDQNRIWVLLPFAGGANAIGMTRVPEEELQRAPARVERGPRRRAESSGQTGGGSKDAASNAIELFKIILGSH